MDIEVLIKRNFSEIKKYCGRFQYDRDERELLFSIVLEKIWKRRYTFIGSTDHEFRKWVQVVAKNAFIDNFRSNPNKNNTLDITEVYEKDLQFPDNYNIENYIDSSILLKNIAHTIKDRFKEKYFIVFKMYYIDELKIREVSELSGIKQQSVKTILKIIRDYIRDPKNILYIEKLYATKGQ